MRKCLLASLVQTGMLAAGLVLATSPLSASETPAGGIPRVKPHLEMTKAYPGQEVSILHPGEMPEGRAVVSFHVSESGQFENIMLLQSSGVAALDAQTMKSVQQASCTECAGHDYTVSYTYQK